MSKKRNDPNRKRVKAYLFKHYGTICMACNQRFKRTDLQLHHIEKWEHTHTTTVEDSSLVCDHCHKHINWSERNNKNEYISINSQIRKYKATH